MCSQYSQALNKNTVTRACMIKNTHILQGIFSKGHLSSWERLQSKNQVPVFQYFGVKQRNWTEQF